MTASEVWRSGGRNKQNLYRDRSIGKTVIVTLASLMRTCGAHDAAVQMIDTSMMRVHQHAATRYDKLAANYLAFIQLASIRLWLRVYEFTA